jgi:hypothetical protein
MVSDVKKFLSGGRKSLDLYMNAIKSSRYYYTYEGLLAQIRLFIQFPFQEDKGSYLKCVELFPKKDH